MESKRMKIVYTIVEREKQKSYWVKCGVAFVNNDGSINVKLDCLPTNGTMQLRDYDPQSDRLGERSSERAERTSGPDRYPPGLA
jgi:hypothetical protein